MDRAELERVLREFFAAEARGVAAAYLFGSFAREGARARSDVDIAILYLEEPEPCLAGLPLDVEAALEARLGRQVQAIVLNTAPPDLVHRVLRDGRLLLDADRSARIRFEVRARNEYFDLEPILRRYRRAVEAAP
jgi:predicted nucleotidyltransferase